MTAQAQAVTTQAQAMTAQDNRDVGTHVNAASRFRDFDRINLPEFHGSKVDEDPKRFTDKVYKALDIIGVSPQENEMLAAYQLKDMTQVWYEQWKGERPIGAGPIKWDMFKSAFLDRFNQEKGSGSPLPKPTCTKCGNKHHGRCLASTDGCYGSGKSDHQVKNCPTLPAKGRQAKKAPHSGPEPNAPNYGRFYACRSRNDQQASPDEGTGM
ncbi:uncharacterized protein LOC125828082 [Solanum verrucosum]|uniref:uncharacterized protein LOC125828082 n=1 Tax=Solanum verrucosum TaxID=315347 RepID=UPI0020D04764|nr:uncharacterized protein LOC125828082 [Solanum verrucosum]